MRCVGCGSEQDTVLLHSVTDDPLGPVVGMCPSASCQHEATVCRDAWLAQAQLYPCVHQSVLVERTVPRDKPYEVFTATQVFYSLRQKRYLVKVYKYESEEILSKHVGIDQLFAINPAAQLVLLRNQFITRDILQSIHPQVTQLPWEGASDLYADVITRESTELSRSPAVELLSQ